MVKLQDFATQQGVTDRQVQRLLKKYESELQDKFERHGHNGTWLTDEACEILRSKMKQQPIVVSDEDPRLEELRREIAALNEEARIKEETFRTVAQISKSIQEENTLLKKENQRLLEENRTVFLLQADNERIRRESESAKQQIEEGKKKVSELERKEKEISFSLSETKKQLQATETVAEINAQERDQERQRAEAAEREALDLQKENDAVWKRLEEATKRNFFQRLSDGIVKFFTE